MKMKPEEIHEMLLIIRDFVPNGFPSTSIGQTLLTRAVLEFVGTHEQLLWLVEIACTRMQRFSLAELRGIYCTRFRPADGIELRPTETPGFSTEELERQYIEAESLEYQQKYQAWKAEAKLLGESPLTDQEKAALLPPAHEMPKASMQERIEEARKHFKLAVAEKILAEQIAAIPKRTPEESQALLEDLQKKLRGEKQEAG